MDLPPACAKFAVVIIRRSVYARAMAERNKPPRMTICHIPSSFFVLVVGHRTFMHFFRLWD